MKPTKLLFTLFVAALVGVGLRAFHVMAAPIAISTVKTTTTTVESSVSPTQSTTTVSGAGGTSTTSTGGAAGGMNPADSASRITTDRSDYLPGDLVDIKGTGFLPGETVTLQVNHLLGDAGGGASSLAPWTATADDAGSLAVSWWMSPDEPQGSLFLVTGVGESAIAADTVFTAAASQACGAASISSVVGIGGACAVSTINGQNQFWDIAQGGTYTVTLSGVTDCSGDSIGVIVHSSDSGNYCTTATGSNGAYTFTFPAPANGCNTNVIEYCTNGCQPGTGTFANDALGGCIGHLRFATFGAGCSKTGNDTDCGGVVPPCNVVITKYYDLNANGALDPNEGPVNGVVFEVDYTPPGGALTSVTVTSGDSGPGKATIDIPAGSAVSVCEELPSTGNTSCRWVQTQPSDSGCYVFTLPAECTGTTTLFFGDVCVCDATAGKTLGFWSNRNGQAILSAHDVAWRTLLNGLCLRNADGSNYDVPGGAFSTAYSNFRTWLLSATATNMAYMLSAQLSATELDAAYTGVNSGDNVLLSPSLAACYGSPTANIGAVMTAANAALCADGVTLSGSPDRAPQECLKSILDAINNNLLPVISGSPCPVVYP